MGEDTVYNETVSPTATNISKEITDKGSKEVKVYINDIRKAKETFNFNTQSEMYIQ